MTTRAQGFNRNDLDPITTTNGVEIIHPAITENDPNKQIEVARIACSTNAEYMGYMKLFTASLFTTDANVFGTLWSNIAGISNPIKIGDWDVFLRLCNSHEFISRSWLMCIVLTLLNGDGRGFGYLITALDANPGNDGTKVYNDFLNGAGGVGGNQYAAFMTPGKHLRDACSAESALPVITQSCTNFLKAGKVIKGGMVKKKKQKIKSQSGGAEHVVVQSAHANAALHWVQIGPNDPDITTAGSKLVGTVQANKKYIQYIQTHNTTLNINFFQKAHCGTCWICGRSVYTYKYRDTRFVPPFELILNPQCGHMEHVVPPGLGNMLGILQNSRNTSLNSDRTPLTERLAYGMRISHAACNVIKLNITFINFPVDANDEYTVNETNVRSFILKLDKFLRSDSKPKSPEFDSFFNPRWFNSDHPGHQESDRVAFFQGVEQNTFTYLQAVVGMLNRTGNDLVRVQSAKMRSINNLLGMFNYKLPSYPIDATNPFSFFSYQLNSAILGSEPTVLAGGGKYVKRGGENEVQDYYEIVQTLLQLSNPEKTKSLDEIKVIHYEMTLREIVNFILQHGDEIFYIPCQNLEDPDYKLFHTKIESGLGLMFALLGLDIEESFAQIPFENYGNTRLIIADLIKKLLEMPKSKSFPKEHSEEEKKMANYLRDSLFNIVDEENLQMQQEKKRIEEFMRSYGGRSAIIALSALREIDKDEDIKHASKIAKFMEQTGYLDAAVVGHALEANGLNFEAAAAAIFMEQTGYTNVDLVKQALGASDLNFSKAKMIHDFMEKTEYTYTNAAVVREALDANGWEPENFEQMLKCAKMIHDFMEKTEYTYTNAAVVREALDANGWKPENFEQMLECAKMIHDFMARTGYQNAAVVREALEANRWNLENFEQVQAYIVINYYGAPHDNPLVIQSLEASGGNFENASIIANFMAQTGYKDAAVVREALDANEGNFENAEAYIVINYYGAPNNNPLVIQSLEASGGNFEYASSIAKEALEASGGNFENASIIANFMAQTGYQDAAVVGKALEANGWDYNKALKFLETRTSKTNWLDKKPPNPKTGRQRQYNNRKRHPRKEKTVVKLADVASKRREQKFARGRTGTGGSRKKKRNIKKKKNSKKKPQKKLIKKSKKLIKRKKKQKN